jgi:hypothetical protein
MLKFAKRFFYPDKELKALDADIAAAAGIADPCERLLRYEAIAGDTVQLRETVESGRLFLGAGFGFAAMIVLGGGLATLALPVVLSGAALFVGAIGSLCFAGLESKEAVSQRAHQCVAAAADLIDRTAVQDFAASPRFETAMKHIPPLSEKFNIALMREKFAPAPSSAPTPSAPGGPV